MYLYFVCIFIAFKYIFCTGYSSKKEDHKEGKDQICPEGKKTEKKNIFGFLIKPKRSENSFNEKKVTKTDLSGIMILNLQQESTAT